MLMVEDVDLTPNPHALKFILNQKLLNYETRQYADKESAMAILSLQVFSNSME
ncbi:MAG: NifU N-terminal domain-containing protein [Ignavibacteriaceae bacterium]|nr:NifU N-terminal domain-containing protein [Ignavibacteriaceae bacterium]